MVATVEQNDGLQALNSNPLVRGELNLIPVSQEPLMIGGFVFPDLEIPVANVRYRTIDLGQASALVLDTLRALDAKAKEIRTETALAEVGVDEYMLKTLVDELKVREARSLGTRYIAEQLSVIRELMVIAKEYRLSQLAISPANYVATHKVVGYDLTSPTIYEDIMALQDIISGSIGRPPNLMVFGRGAFRKAKVNQVIVDRYSTPLGGGVRITSEILADFFEVPTVINGIGGYRTDAGVFVPFWDNVIWMGYVEARARQLNNLSFGYNIIMTYDGIKFDTRQTDPQGVERLIEAGCCERYRPALMNADAAALVTTL